jgi:CheY-like chemotaxis protein
MKDTAQHWSQLKSLVAENRRLAAEAWHHAREIEELLAVRKDALRRDRKSTEADGFNDLTCRVLAPQPHLGRTVADLPPFADTSSDRVLLVVEDEPDDFLLLHRALKKAGKTSRVRWVQTGHEALRLLGEMESQDLTICVVADVKLPGMDGFELLQRMKSRNRCARLVFAFLTGKDDVRTRELAYARGADAFFVKPGRAEDLMEVARALLHLATRA